MSTVVALIGAAIVPATFHVTVAGPPPLTVPLAGAVTRNGPALPTTLTVVSAEDVPPPPARLSRATTRNDIVRVVVGRLFPVVLVPLRMSFSWGKVRVAFEL